MEPRVLASETVDFRFNGERNSFCVYEMEEGYWAIECRHELFQAANGSIKAPKAESVDEALQALKNTSPQLATAMQEAYDAICRNHIASYQGWISDRRTFYLMN